MAISSVSRIYDAPDPIMQTDLELLAKVNTFEQAKFDQGEADLQNEVNNWAMLADVAKPQDRQYINGKLNNLVSGIKNLGGVNLRDVNNVNSLKALGYNLYGDNNITNAVITTKKLRGFMTDAQSKLSGKDAGNYDSVYYDYQLNKWNKWLQDGQVGTSFNGPTQLGAGSFDAYQKKINDAISKLTPDSEEAPQGSDALNYLQVGSKFIKKERINQLIDAMTTAQDRDIISAHAWKNLSGTSDDDLLKYTVDGYNSKLDTLKSDYNTLKHTMAQTQDFKQKQMFQSQLNILNGAIKDINDKKTGLYNETNGKSLNDDQRDLLRTNLYFDSYKNELSSARAFEQNKTELKVNEIKEFQLRQAQEASQFSKNYDLRQKEYNLNLRKEDFAEQKALMELGLTAGITGNPTALNNLGLLGPSAFAPLVTIETKGKDDATKMDENTVTTANTNYAAAASNFYKDAYNTLGALPEYQQYVTKQQDGTFVPANDSAKAVLNQAIQTKLKNFDNIATLPLEDRKNYENSLSQDDAQLLANYRNLKEAELYRGDVNDLEDQAFRNAGLQSPGDKMVNVYYTGTNARDQMIFTKPTQQISLRKLKEMQDSNDPRLKQMIDQGAFFTTEKMNDPRQAIAFVEPTQQLTNIVKNYYDQAKKGWEDVSATYSPFGRNVNIPKGKGGKPNENLAKYFEDVVRQQAETKNKSVLAEMKQDDIDLNRVWVQYNADAKGDTPAANSKLRYMAEVRYKKGNAKEGDKFFKVDITNDVLNNPDSYVAKLYPRDNASIIYGLMMDKDGMTPLDDSDHYASALETYSNPALTHKYQIVAKQNTNGTTLAKNFRVYLLVPKKDSSAAGGITYTKIPVRNTYNKDLSYDFPDNFDAIVDYMNQKFATEQKAKEFYQINGIPTN